MAGGGTAGGKSSGDHGSGGKKHKSKGSDALKGQGSEGLLSPTTTTLHWHAHAVTALALSPDGRYYATPRPLILSPTHDLPS